MQEPWEGHNAPSPPCLHAAGDLEFNNLMSAVQLQASFACALFLVRRMLSYRSQAHAGGDLMLVSPEAFQPLSRRAKESQGCSIPPGCPQTPPALPVQAAARQPTGAAPTLSASQYLLRAAPRLVAPAALRGRKDGGRHLISPLA